jgi:hypothetical protein
LAGWEEWKQEILMVSVVEVEVSEGDVKCRRETEN